MPPPRCTPPPWMPAAMQPIVPKAGSALRTTDGCLQPMATNTLDEAASWLSETRGRPWSAKQVLDAVITRCDQSAIFPSENITCLRVIPPKNTVFGLYKCGPETYARSLHRLTRDCHFQLNERAARALFDYQEVRVLVVRASSGADDPHVVIEPTGESLRVTADMLRISAGELKNLAQADAQDALMPPVKEDDFSFHWEASAHTREVEARANLMFIANECKWDTLRSLPMVAKSLPSIVGWDSSILKELRDGPPPEGAASTVGAATVDAPPVDASNPSMNKPVQRHVAQENEILTAIANLDFAALALPKNEKGKQGVKAMVRHALGTTGMWSYSTVFNKAWERLAAKKLIKIIN